MFQKMEPRTEMKNKQFAVEGTVKYTDDGGKEKWNVRKKKSL